MAGYDPYSANNPLKPRARGQFAPVPQPEPPQPPTNSAEFVGRRTVQEVPSSPYLVAKVGTMPVSQEVRVQDASVNRPPTYAPAPNPDVPMAQPGGFMPQYVQNLQPRGRPSGFSAAPIVSSTPPTGATAPAPPSDPNALPEGVTRRTDNFFEGKGTHGEPVYSDTAYAPQFAGVAGATGADQERFKNGYAGARGGGNMATEADAFEMARKGELERAGADYKAYVAAGSPRTKDGRGLTEYDFLQNQRQAGLDRFLDSNAGGEGSRQSDRSDLFGRRGGPVDAEGNLLKNAKTEQEIALEAAKGGIEVQKGSLDIADRLRKRGDEAIAAGVAKYKENPIAMAKKYGATGLTPEEASALDFAMTEADAQGADFFDTPAGRLARGAMSKIGNSFLNNRSDSEYGFGSKRGVTDGNPADIAQFEFTRNRDWTRSSDYNLRGPAFSKSDPSAQAAPSGPDDVERRTTRVGGRNLFDSPEASFYNDEGFGSLLQKIKSADRIKAERNKK